jgi:glycosyltransferase involved in cell wall biosynthesis
VNDGSPDTPELELALASLADRIVYLKTDNNGIAGARNNGIRASKGEIIALLDSDDIWEPNYLEVQVHKLDEDPSADIVYCRYLIFGDGPGSGTISGASRGEVTFVSLVRGTCCVAISALARRTALERVGLFDSNLRSSEDFDLWLRCVKSGSRIIYHNEVLFRYRRRADSMSSDPVWMCGSALRVLMKMRSAVETTAEERRILESAIRRHEGNKLFFEGKQAFISGNISAAIAYLEEANARLHNSRLWLILIVIRAIPQIARTVYMWRSHQR